MNDIKLELITDIDMFQFIEKGMRSDISYRTNRNGKGNMRDYDKNKASKYIMYLDAKNLHGWAISQFLPTSAFKRIMEKEVEKIDLGTCKEDGEKGMILEVDLEHLKNLHNHNDYPL